MVLKNVVLRRRAPQPGGSYPRRTVTGTRLSGIGGLLVFVGAVAFVLHIVLRSVLTAGVDPDAYFAFGLDLLLAGIEAMAVRKR